MLKFISFIEKPIRRHTIINHPKNTYQLPSNFAESLLNLELDIESE